MRAGQDICCSQINKMSKNMRRIARKGQEEILGFVLIVVIVAVVFLIFLGISVRQGAPATQKEGADVNQFLRSTMEYTTACTVSYEPNYLNMGGLLRECFLGSTCRSGERACDVLSRAMEDVIETNWKIGPDRPVQGYILNSSYISESSQKEVFAISKGKCAGEKIGGEDIFPVYPGNIRTSLQICY